jgi:hypothetical protein
MNPASLAFRGGKDISKGFPQSQSAVSDHHTDPFNTAFFDIAQEVTP